MKMLTNKYLKTLWMKSCDPYKSIKDLEFLQSETERLIGPNTFRQCKILMELGEAYLQVKEKEKGLALLEEGRVLLETLHGKDHALY